MSADEDFNEEECRENFKYACYKDGDLPEEDIDIGSLTLDKDHYAEFLRCMGQNPTQKELDAQFETLDKNGDDMLSYEEAVTLYKKDRKTNEDMRNKYKEILGMFDNNGDGKLSKEELHQFLMSGEGDMSREDIDAIFDEMNTDDFIDLEELLAYLVPGYKMSQPSDE